MSYASTYTAQELIVDLSVFCPLRVTDSGVDLINCKEESLEKDISDLGDALCRMLFTRFFNDVTLSFHLCMQFFYGLFHSSLGTSCVRPLPRPHSQRPALTSFLLDLLIQAWAQGVNRISGITEVRLFQALALLHPDFAAAMSTLTPPLFSRLHHPAIRRRAARHHPTRPRRARV